MDIGNNQLRVLLTGASGYLAGHVLNHLLNRGFKVRGTVRSLKDIKKVNHIYEINPSKRDNLELIEADLLDPKSWDSAMKDIDYVIHTASPFPSSKPQSEDEIIKPALLGTQNIFEAALKHNVKKIVLTSSSAAVSTGVIGKNVFTSNDWSNLVNQIFFTEMKILSSPYEKSKHLAEKKAWEIYEKNKDKIQMTIILPGFIQGPSFHSNEYTSSQFITKVMKNDLPGIPKVSLATVDVRDVSLAHVICLEQEKLEITNGKRYILVEGSYWMYDLIEILKEEFLKHKYKFPSFTIESKLLFSMAGCIDDKVELVKPYFGRRLLFDNTPSKNDLGMNYRFHRNTFIEYAYDLIEKGYIPNKLPNQKINPNIQKQH